MSAPGESMGDIGPTTPSRFAVYSKAGEIRHLALQAQELSTQGPKMDVARAAQLLEQIKAVLG